MNWSYKIADYLLEITSGEQIKESPLSLLCGFDIFYNEKYSDQIPFIRYSTSASKNFTHRARTLAETNTSMYSISFEGIDCDLFRIDSFFLFRMVPSQGETHFFIAKPKNNIFAVESNYELNPNPTILRFSLWMAMSIAVSYDKGILIHSSTLIYNKKAYLFLGESGTGKSTHTRLWREYIYGAGLLNDDSPLVRVIDGKIFAYGSPWSGKTPCFKNERYPLGGVVRLSQAPFNKITRQSVLNSFAALYPSCPPAFIKDNELSDNICATLSDIISQVAVYRMECLPNKEAALMVKDAFDRNNK